MLKTLLSFHAGFPSGSDAKASVCNAGDPGLIPGLGRAPGEGDGSPLQYSCLENPMDRGTRNATVHGVAKSRARLRDFTFVYYSPHSQTCRHRGLPYSQQTCIYCLMQMSLYKAISNNRKRRKKLTPLELFFFFLALLSCGILVPWPGIKPEPLAVEAWSPNHWTAREFPPGSLIISQD